MKRIAFVVVAIMLPFSFAACGSEGAGRDGLPPAGIDNEYRVPVKGTDDVLVIEFSLNDGTRCVVSDGYNSGGIACDWN